MCIDHSYDAEVPTIVVDKVGEGPERRHQPELDVGISMEPDVGISMEPDQVGQVGQQRDGDGLDGPGAHTAGTWDGFVAGTCGRNTAIVGCSLK